MQAPSDADLLDLMDRIEQTPAKQYVPTPNRHPLADVGHFTAPEVDDSLLLEIDVDQLVAQRAAATSYSSSSPSSEASLANVLKKYYRFGQFRGGQLEVIQAALRGQDASIVWPTGQGKSLCYILPALASHRVTVVVSPLISLMEDQVRGINLTVGHALGHDVACFLGSGQSDPHVEGRAFAGDFLLVYLSPEKLSSSLAQLAQLHQRLQQRGSAIGLLAVDEAHCCSQWGHDFRPSFQRIGDFRDQPVLSDIPIMALTATAGKKVKDDIRAMLKMRPDCVISALSVDRANLAITVTNERVGIGLEGNLRFLVDRADSAGGVAKLGATIVYCTTQKEVDAVASMLRARLVPGGGGGKTVMQYHAGLPAEARKEAHYAFLTGECVVLVATVAFGMGIDKADIRRVVHFGCPLSLEEYLQQIGRAGRDGEPSECVMIYSDGEMAPRLGRRLGDLHNPVLKQAASDNFDAIRAFAKSTTACRRGLIMKYFGEPQTDKCDNCDLCVAKKQHGEQNVRDFTAEARLILEGVRVGGGCTPKQVIEVVMGTYKPKSWAATAQQQSGMAALSAQLQALPAAATTFARRRPLLTEYLKTLLDALVDAKYVALSLRTSSHGTFNSAYHLCQLTPLGNSLLADHAATVALAVPQMLRKEEQEAAQRRDALKTTLAAQGIDVGQIPEDELTHASGTSAAGLDPRAAPSIAWHQHLHRLRTAGLGDDAATWAALLQRVHDWRARKARELTLAPVAVLTDADAYRVAYQRATRPADLRDLVRVGAAVDDLAATMLRAVMELFPAPPPVVAAAADGGTQMFAVFSAAGHTPASSSSSGDAFITFPAAFVPVHWPLAKLPAKKEPVWQASARAFAAGQSLVHIAVGNKNCKGATIVGHLLEALTHGIGLDLRRLGAEAAALQDGPAPPPGAAEWAAMEAAAAAIHLDVVNTEYFPDKDVLRAIPAAARLMAPDGQPPDQDTRSPADKEAANAWYHRVRWWKALRRCGFVPTFSSGENSAGNGDGVGKRTSEEAFGHPAYPGASSLGSKATRPA